MQTFQSMIRLMKALTLGFVLVAMAMTGRVVAVDPLTTLEYRVVGQELRVSPAAVAVPKGIAGSIAACMLTLT